MKLTSELFEAGILLVFDKATGWGSIIALIGSNGVKPRFAANLGTLGFHLGPNNYKYLNLIFNWSWINIYK